MFDTPNTQPQPEPADALLAILVGIVVWILAG